MRREIIEKLSRYTDEEMEILNGNSIRRQSYTDKETFEVDAGKLLRRGQLITVRPHTRFIDFPQHSHNYIEILYVCQGSVTNVIGEETLVMEAGDLIFLNQHIRHGLLRAGERDIGINIIALPEFFDLPIKLMGTDNILANFLVDSLRGSSAESQYLLFRLRGNLLVENLMENIVHSLFNENGYAAQTNQISMGLLFMYVVNSLESLDGRSKNNYREILLRMTIRYINDQYRGATLTQLARDTHQSVPALSRFISRNLGFSFQELLMRKRFQQAVYLLVETKLPVSDIVTSVGYENSSYFYRKFREKFQMSPKEYRLSHLQDNLIRF